MGSSRNKSSPIHIAIVVAVVINLPTPIPRSEDIYIPFTFPPLVDPIQQSLARNVRWPSDSLPIVGRPKATTVD